ncbi:MAG TPA: hypothetical protein PK765_02325, partial [bacterium]|nr:hypothetical protein [bacterium]
VPDLTADAPSTSDVIDSDTLQLLALRGINVSDTKVTLNPDDVQSHHITYIDADGNAGSVGGMDLSRGFEFEPGERLVSVANPSRDQFVMKVQAADGGMTTITYDLSTWLRKG